MAANSSGTELRGVVAVGGSAGGVEAVTALAGGLPADFPYAVLVVLHIPVNSPSVLARIIDRSGPLPAVNASNGQPLEGGRIYVGIPDHHLLVEQDRLILSQGPTENRHRPAINALFRSVALAYGSRSAGVLLSGVLDDGVLGLEAIRSRGGLTVAQSPDEAMFDGMPRHAVEAGVVDHVVRTGDAGQRLAQWMRGDVEEGAMPTDRRMELENRIAMGRRFTVQIDAEELGDPSGYTCPDCNGSLMMMGGRGFRCRVGHAWSDEALLEARDSEVEGALWVALRSLQEKSRLARRMADTAGPGGQQRYVAIAEEAEHALTVLGDRLAGEDLDGVGEQS